MQARPITIALTGASGAGYGLRLIEVLAAAGHPVYVLISDTARLVINTETDCQLPEDACAQQHVLTTRVGSKDIRVVPPDDWWTPAVSGSGAPDSMVVCPCSMSTLSAIAGGASNNLIQRAADVALKERNRLILVPRETPLSTLHLENMLRLSRMGVLILPACPGFYHRPGSLDETTDFVVDRILCHLDSDIRLAPAWGRVD